MTKFHQTPPKKSTAQPAAQDKHAIAAKPEEKPGQPAGLQKVPGAAAKAGLQGQGTPASHSKPMAGPAQPHRRHLAILASFLAFVLLPLVVAAWYLFTKAEDQFTSQTAFAVRTEDISSAIDILGGLSALGGGSTSDADILYEFIQSQGLVRQLDVEMNLRRIYSEPYDRDPWFAYNPEGTIEDLTEYWGQMVKVFYDRGTGLIELRVHAFTPEDAQEIAQAIFASSSKMINEFSDIAREDATRYAREELDRSQEQLRQARQALTEYRSRYRIVDPQAEIGLQTGLLSALEAQLSDALIEYDVLADSAGRNDPRLNQADDRVQIIRDRIEEERAKYASTGAGSENYATLVGEYERLAVDREFAEQSYFAARAAYESALTEAQRQSRYLAAYISPTIAERAAYPQRWILLGLLGLFMFLSWTIGTLIFYAIKDRR